MRSVFVATSAYLGRIDGPTRVAFWTEDPKLHDFDQTKLIELDLAHTPNAAMAGRISWDAIVVDDAMASASGNFGGSTLGPRWPELQVTGMVLLEVGFLARLPAHLHPGDPAIVGGRAYEYQGIVYWPQGPDPRAGKRYAGHHAEIVEERGTLARVHIYPPGTSDHPSAKPSTMWIDLASPEQCDVGRDALTTIRTGDGPKQGALFLIAGEI